MTPGSGVYPVLATAEAERPADAAVARYSVRYGTVWPIYTDMLNGSTNCVRAAGSFTLDGPLGPIVASGATGCY